MKFLGKWLDLEGIILSELTQSQKNSDDMYSLISGYLPRKLVYPRYKIQFAVHFLFLMGLLSSQDHETNYRLPVRILWWTRGLEIQNQASRN